MGVCSSDILAHSFAELAEHLAGDNDTRGNNDDGDDGDMSGPTILGYVQLAKKPGSYGIC